MGSPDADSIGLDIDAAQGHPTAGNMEIVCVGIVSQAEHLQVRSKNKKRVNFCNAKEPYQNGYERLWQSCFFKDGVSKNYFIPMIRWFTNFPTTLCL